MPAGAASTRASTQRNRAPRCSEGTLSSGRNSFALFAASEEFPDLSAAAESLSSAANRAECTPGAPPRASTSNPESSASTRTFPRGMAAFSAPVCRSQRASSSAFLAALPAKVGASSITAGAPGKSFRVLISRPWERMARISAALCALRVAITRVVGTEIGAGITGRKSGCLVGENARAIKPPVGEFCSVDELDERAGRAKSVRKVRGPNGRPVGKGIRGINDAALARSAAVDFEAKVAVRQQSGALLSDHRRRDYTDQTGLNKQELGMPEAVVGIGAVRIKGE